MIPVLSRAEMRRREMAIRLSLGAGMTRLLAMLLTEGLFLSCLALPISAYVAYQVPRVAKAMVPMASWERAGICWRLAHHTTAARATSETIDCASSVRRWTMGIGPELPRRA